jgi:colicin import membrane protein|tara:strand:- start:459 stop:770 length:312 start_codon:yes stop_codon:yes gene_type:complete
MTTSYKLEAIKALKAAKKELRAQEEAFAKAEKEAEERKHQANLQRIAKKMARIEAGLPVEDSGEEKPKKTTAKKSAPKKKAEPKKTTAKKAPAKKRGRPAKSK